MLRKLRRSSQVTLVLIGVAALSGCGGERRDVYATREDCLADWGNKPEDCKPASDAKHANRGFFYGPIYAGRMGSSSWGRSANSVSSTRASGSGRSIGSSGSSSRGGFGASGRSSSG